MNELSMNLSYVTISYHGLKLVIDDGDNVFFNIFIMKILQL